MNVVRHRGSRLVVRSMRHNPAAVRWWRSFKFSARIGPLFIQSDKLSNYVFWEKTNLDVRFQKRDISVHDSSLSATPNTTRETLALSRREART